MLGYELGREGYLIEDVIFRALHHEKNAKRKLRRGF